MKGFRLRRFWALATIVFGVAPGALGAEVSSRFEPNEIALGGHAQLIVDASCRRMAEEVVPFSVDGLPMRRMGTAHSIGEDGSNLSRITYAVFPQQTGIYALNGATIYLDDKVVAVPSAQLTVLSDADAEFRGGRLRESLRRMSLSVGPFPEKMFAGQVLPIEISMAVEPNVRVRLNGEIPIKIGSGFHVGSSCEVPVEKIIQLAQPHCEELRWRTLLTVGDGSSCDVAFSLNFDGEERGNFTGMASAAEMFGQMFAEERWVPLRVYSQRHFSAVGQLPKIGRPPDFCGAIGTFAMGDCRLRKFEGGTVEISFAVNGSGTFGQLQIPELSVDGGRVQRKSRTIFEPTDRLGYGGTVEFRYAVIPSEAMVATFSFCFFNPETGEYEHLVAQMGERGAPQRPSNERFAADSAKSLQTEQ
ncbi:MAG: hypothetical protein LBI39_00835 [Puniceicoccales bacterium]|nr:hypothetical protein [Puniceicoccales bacterium]